MENKVGMPKIVVKKETYSLSTILGVLFITLKLCHVINWSWVWVLCPFWISFALVFGFIAFVLFIMCLGVIASAILDHKKK
jgi:hypothetical protein